MSEKREGGIHMARGLAIALLGVGLILPSVASAGRHGGRNLTVSTDDSSPVRTCADIRVLFSGREAARSEERLSAVPGLGPLSLRLPENSGIWVRGTDRRDFGVVACKAAESAAALSRVSVSLGNGELKAAGPDEGGWVVHFIVEAPRNADLDLGGRNGPIQVEDMAGRVAARISNGPLGFRNCTGTIRAEAENGPIDLDGSSGEISARATNGPISVDGRAGSVRVDTENGPISVRLRGDSWENGSLEARAINGPLSLQIPRGYRTGTVVQSDGHSPFQCRVEACGEARKSWDDDSRRVEFGRGSTAIRLSTVNGPVSVESAKD
ncbi:MAG: hypothetical protein M3R62_04030 [Acidobacteriota bacterium]|nr:hypothetical protein [Acidobacteriota bacterium]